MGGQAARCLPFVPATPPPQVHPFAMHRRRSARPRKRELPLRLRPADLRARASRIAWSADALHAEGDRTADGAYSLGRGTFGAGTIICIRSRSSWKPPGSSSRSLDPREARSHRTSPTPRDHRTSPVTRALRPRQPPTHVCQYSAELRLPAPGLEPWRFPSAYGNRRAGPVIPRFKQRHFAGNHFSCGKSAGRCTLRRELTFDRCHCVPVHCSRLTMG